MDILPTPGSEDCGTISTISDFCSFHLAVFAWKPQEADGADPRQDLRPIAGNFSMVYSDSAAHFGTAPGREFDWVTTYWTQGSRYWWISSNSDLMPVCFLNSDITQNRSRVSLTIGSNSWTMSNRKSCFPFHCAFSVRPISTVIREEPFCSAESPSVFRKLSPQLPRNRRQSFVLHQLTQREWAETAERSQKISASDQRNCKVHRIWFLSIRSRVRTTWMRIKNTPGSAMDREFRKFSEWGLIREKECKMHPSRFVSSLIRIQINSAKKEASRRNGIMIDSERAGQFSASLIDSQVFW